MNPLKRQILPAGLWIVATPIGNLGDLSARALQALSECHKILCEDTRRTAQLLTALGVKRPEGGLERLDAHASPAKIAAVVAALGDGAARGLSYALVTDAGTPAISDPGASLVGAALKAGVVVTPLPGASAVMALLSVCGFEESAFLFRGFFPRKTADREGELERAKKVAELGFSQVFVWFESPERIVGTLEWLAGVAPSAQVVAAKELTKIHEQFFTGGSFLVAEQVKLQTEAEGARGEWCFAVSLPRNDEEKTNNVEETIVWSKTLLCLRDAGVSASEAAKCVSRNFGVPKNEVYESALKIFSKKVQRGVD